MEAMRLGTLPIVAPTGGLKDTVEERCVGACAYVLLAGALGGAEFPDGCVCGGGNMWATLGEGQSRTPFLMEEVLGSLIEFASMFVEVEPTHFQDFPRSIPEQATMCLHAVWS